MAASVLLDNREICRSSESGRMLVGEKPIADGKKKGQQQ
jgi:hypothetical protein